MKNQEVGRVYMNVPYAEKEDAKRLGARWCPVRRQWWVTHDALLGSPALSRWVTAAAIRRKGTTQRDRVRKGSDAARWARKQAEVRTSAREDFSLPDCRCPTPPWERCQHTRTP